MRYHCVVREIHTKHFVVDAQNAGDAEVILHNEKFEDKKNISELTLEEHSFAYRALHVLKDKKWQSVKQSVSWPKL